MISFHVELGFLAWLPYPLMDLLRDNPSRFPFCSLCIHCSFSFPRPFIIIERANFYVTWLRTWYLHLLCQEVLLYPTSLTLIISSFTWDFLSARAESDLLPLPSGLPYFSPWLPSSFAADSDLAPTSLSLIPCCSELGNLVFRPDHFSLFFFG